MPSRTAASARKRTDEPRTPKLPAALADASESAGGVLTADVYQGLAFQRADLSGASGEGVDITGCRFSASTLAAGRLRRTDLTDVEVSGCDLSNVEAAASRMTRVTLTGCKITGFSWSDGGLTDVLIDNCRGDDTGFRFSAFHRVTIRDTTLRDATFQNADLRGVRFVRCELTGVQFSGANLTGTRFEGCTLTGIGGITALKGAVVPAADLPGLAEELAAALGIVTE